MVTRWCYELEYQEIIAWEYCYLMAFKFRSITHRVFQAISLARNSRLTKKGSTELHIEQNRKNSGILFQKWYSSEPPNTKILTLWSLWTWFNLDLDPVWSSRIQFDAITNLGANRSQPHLHNVNIIFIFKFNFRDLPGPARKLLQEYSCIKFSTFDGMF